MRKKVLVVGGAGYIGSHMVRMLVEAKRSVVVYDNLSTGKRQMVDSHATFVKGDTRDAFALRKLFRLHKFDSVICFAASLIVPESVAKPLEYYENNVAAVVNLLKAMREAGVDYFVFSSTAATYGEPKRMPVREDDPKEPTSPYGMSKLMTERVLRDLNIAEPDFRYAALRYFNVCGAHPSGTLGAMKKKETLLIPNVLRAVRQGPAHPLIIFGDDYKTPDGTCQRDYVHVVDICSAHLLALRYLERGGKSDVFNLGCGKGYSVKEVVDAAEKALSLHVPVKYSPRRAGDPSRVVASSAKAARILKWKPTFDLRSMIETAWRWEQKKAGNKTA